MHRFVPHIEGLIDVVLGSHTVESIDFVVHNPLGVAPMQSGFNFAFVFRGVEVNVAFDVIALDWNLLEGSSECGERVCEVETEGGVPAPAPFSYVLAAVTIGGAVAPDFWRHAIKRVNTNNDQ